MLYLFDNDFIIKLINFDLMDSCLSLYNIEKTQIRILDTLKYKVRKLKKDYSSDIIIKIENFIKDIDVIDDINDTDYTIFSKIQEIDIGEAILFINANRNKESLILTSDKRSVKALCSNYDIKNRFEGLNGKILIFEQVLLKLFQNNYQETKNKIINKINQDFKNNFKIDKTINIMLSQKELTPKEHIFICLNSNIDEIKQLDEKILTEL